MTDLPPCDPALKVCEDIAAGNEIATVNESQGGIDILKVALLAVGGV